MKTYESEHAFYNDPADNYIGARRKKSGELDFGYHCDGITSARNFRVSFVDDTGEIVAVKLIGSMPVEVLAVVGDADAAEGLLAGWEDAPDINWFRERCK